MEHNTQTAVVDTMLNFNILNTILNRFEVLIFSFLCHDFPNFEVILRLRSGFYFRPLWHHFPYENERQYVQMECEK